MSIFSKALKIKMLEKKVGNALGVVTSTIDSIEKTNAEYDKVRQELEDEMTIAREHHMGVLSAMAQNKKVVQNFKNLLK